ncbi:uncharacterized protein FRV6_10359 [Fusarium oxysporum]|uniref:Uncharacterized protein n=1 Tax=Fusarium oxysporum TaxID=5507 RepID=A0A2H3TC61_FUSOX|nr:uncharacterized protein FRV6_10359 [Fusarium oxysporum]
MTAIISVTKPQSQPQSIVGDKPWVLPRNAPFNLTNAKLIDPVEGRVIENTTITVSGGIFMEVSVGQPPHDGIQSIDLGGKYADLKSTCKNIPALMNNFRTTFLAREMLQRGFTTARDCGGADGSLKDAIDEWLIAGHALSQTVGHGD